MEQVQLINIQRLLEAAEYLERRERGNGRRGAGATASCGGSGAGVRNPCRGVREPLAKGIGASVRWWVAANAGAGAEVRGRAGRPSPRWWLGWEIFVEKGRRR